MFKDIGNWVGRYFQVLACLSVAWMILDVILNDRLYLDLTFLLFLWAGYYLRRHNPTARRWTLRLGGVGMVLIVLVFAYSVIAGTQGMKVNLAGKKIENPSIGEVAATCGIILVVMGLPVALLLTARAKREFTSGGRTSPELPPGATPS